MLSERKSSTTRDKFKRSEETAADKDMFESVDIPKKKLKSKKYDDVKTDKKQESPLLKCEMCDMKFVKFL